MSEDRMDRMEKALRRIAEWADIDRISASAMRYVITQVGKIAADALRDD